MFKLNIAYIHNLFIIIVLFLLPTLKVFSQNKIIVDYGVVFNVSLFPEELKAKSPQGNKMVEQMAESADKLTFKLMISEQQSYFMHPPVDKAESGQVSVYSWSDGEHVFYTDVKNKKILEQFNFWGVDILVKIDFDEYPWELIDEKKTIHNYVCSKAVKKIGLMNGNGEEYVLNVEAWYTEEVPLNYGPKDYCGLPGLILELTETEKKLTYYVKKIDYNGDFEAFQAPTKGIEMSLREYSENIRAIKRKGKQTFLNSRG